MANAAHRLPPELLLEVFRAANPLTRVRASHVSRAWRNIALSDRRLWDSFSCSKFIDVQHEDAMFDQLQAALVRSCPLPFRLCIPHRSCCRSELQYTARLCALDRLDACRLSLYEGPLDIFFLLNRDQVPLPTLNSLNIVDAIDAEFSRALIYLDSEISPTSLPNLQCLHAHYIHWSADPAPFPEIQYLSCSLAYTRNYRELFKVFPSLIHLQLNDLTEIFPPVSLPRSLQKIVLRANGVQYISTLVRNWAEQHIPLLVMHKTNSLLGLLPLFLVSHPHRVELRVHSRNHDLELDLVTLPSASSTWTITPSPWCKDGDFLGALETRGCERLTAISVATEQLARFFAAQLDVPALERLKFCLIGTQSLTPRHAAADHFVRAPRLKRVVFNADDNIDAVCEHMDDTRRVLGVLCAWFRALIVYDAALLDCITLSAPAACMQYLGCVDLACYTKEYRVVQT